MEQGSWKNRLPVGILFYSASAGKELKLGFCQLIPSYSSETESTPTR